MSPLINVKGIYAYWLVMVGLRFRRWQCLMLEVAKSAVVLWSGEGPVAASCSR